MLDIMPRSPMLAFSEFMAKALKPHHAVNDIMLYYVNCSTLQDPIIALCTMASTISLLTKHILQGNFVATPSPNNSAALFYD